MAETKWMDHFRNYMQKLDDINYLAGLKNTIKIEESLARCLSARVNEYKWLCETQRTKLVT